MMSSTVLSADRSKRWRVASHTSEICDHRIRLFSEALFYFNPALWWLSRQVRIEREASCDALATRAG